MSRMIFKKFTLSFRLVIILISLLIILLVAGCSNKFEEQSKKLNEELEKHGLSKCGGDFNNVSCYFKLAVEKQDVSICDEIKFLSIGKNIEDLNEEELDELNAFSATFAYEHINSCYIDVAVKNEDPSFCNKLDSQDNKDFCYSEVAKEILDPSICDKVQGENVKTSCLIDSYKDFPKDRLNDLSFDTCAFLKRFTCINSSMNKVKSIINLVLENNVGDDTDLSVKLTDCKTPATGILKSGQQNTLQIKDCTLNKDFFLGYINITFISIKSGLVYTERGVIKVELVQI